VPIVSDLFYYMDSVLCFFALRRAQAQRRARGPARAFPGPAGALYESMDSTQRTQFWLLLVVAFFSMLWQTLASVNPLQVYSATMHYFVFVP
jgi:hypothetical protein